MSDRGTPFADAKGSAIMSETLSSRARKRLTSLDLLRSLAIILVFTFHFPKTEGHSLFGPVGKFGWMGVDLFFALSGFLIGNQILKAIENNSFSFTSFYRSRFLRAVVTKSAYRTWTS